MAVNSITRTLDNLNSSTLIKSMGEAVTNNVGEDRPLLKHLLKNRQTYDGGVMIDFPLRYANLEGFDYHGFSKHDVATKEVLTRGYVYPMSTSIPVAISETDMDENSGKAQIINLVEELHQAALDGMDERLDSKLWSNYSRTDGVADLWSIADIVKTTPASDPSGGNFGNISQADYSWWRNKEKQTAVATSALTNALINDTYAEGSTAADRPTIGITTKTIWNKAWSLADAAQRNGNELTKEIGATAINFNGTPLIVDENATALQIRWLNNKYLFFKVLASKNFSWTEWHYIEGVRAFVRYLDFTGQLICTRRNRQCVGTVTS